MSKLMLYEEEKLIYPSELCYENELYDSHPKPVEDKTVQTIDKVLDVPLIQPKNTFSEKHLSPPPGFANPPNPFGPPSLAPQYSWSFLENAVKTTQEQFQIQPDQNMTWQQFVKASNKSLELQIEISQAFNTVLSKMLRNSQNAYPNYVANPQVPPTNINPQVLPGATANLNVNGNRNIYSKPKIRGVRRLNTNSVSNDSKSSIDQGTKGYPFQNPNIATSNNVKSDSFISLNPFRTATVNAADTSKDINVINGSYCGNTSNKINVTDSCTSTYSTSVSSGATNGLPMEQPKSPVDYSSLFKTNTPVCNNVIDENGVKNNINDNFTPLITSPKSKDVFVETNPFKLGLTGKSAIPEPNKKETQSLLGEYYKTPVTTNYSDALNRTTDVEQASYDLSSSNNQDLSVPSPAHYSFDGNHNAVGINLWSFKAKGHLNSDAGIEESALHNGTVKENITSVLKINSEKRQEYLSNNMTENHQRTQADLYDFSNKGSGLFSTFIDQNHFLRRTSISIDTTAAFVDGQISKVPVMEKERTQSPEEAQELHEFSNGYSESNNALVNKYSTGRKPMNPAAPEWTPTTGFATPLTIEKSPIDEGYQTGPTTTNTLPSSPPLLVELPFGKKNQVLKTKSIDSKKSDSDSRQIQKSPETTERKQSTQSPHPRPEVYKCGLDMFCRIVDLPNCPVHIFHYSGEGWILSEDFVDVFTDLKTVTYMISLLQILDLEIRFKEVAVTRLKLLDQSNSELNKNIEDDGESKDCKVHLTPLKSIIKVLIKLGVVTRDEIHRAIVKKDIIQGSAPHEMISMVIRAYGELLQVIEKRE